MTARRYAVYFAPRPESRLGQCGSAWLGRDAVTNSSCPQPDLPADVPVDLAAATARPRHYGFHATLKAPFRLHGNCTEAALIRAAQALCTRHETFSITLEVGELDGFIALLPKSPTNALDHLAADCVRELDAFRAPLTDTDRRRRDAARLPPRQRVLFEQWGYPHVLDAFRFHMTLSERLPDGTRQRLYALAEAYFEPVLRGETTPVDSICLFREATPGGMFSLLQRIDFTPRNAPPHEFV